MTTDISTLPAYPDDLLEQFSADRLVELMIGDEDRVPRNVIDRCAAHGDAMVERLRRLLDRDAAWQSGAALGEWWLLLHATMILGLIHGESAGCLLVHMMRRMAQEGDDNLQGWLAGRWPMLFRNKPPAAIAAARALAEDRALDWYIRCQAADVVIDAARREGSDRLDRDLDWLARMAEDDAEDWDYRLTACHTLLDFPRERHRPLLAGLAAREAALADERPTPIVSFSTADIDSAFARASDRPGWERLGDPWRFYSRGAILARQDRWAEEAERGDPDFDIDDLDQPLHLPFVREAAKVGRNDPCPCGSGKKYKKCCLPRASA
jgi:hypothetical protein